MDYEQLIREELARMELQELNASGGSLPTVEEIVMNSLHGQPLFSFDAVIDGLLDLLFLEVRNSLILFTELVAACILIGLLKSLSGSFGGKPVSDLGIAVCMCVVIGLSIKSFTESYEIAADAVGVMTRTMLALLPALIPVLVMLGNVSAAGLLNPLITGAVTGFNGLLRTVVLPLAFLSGIFCLINGLTEKSYIGRLAKLMGTAAVVITGLAATIFSGLACIQGIASRSADGVLVNTAKYSMSAFIPFVGNFAADSLGMVLACVGVIRTGLTIFGVIAILAALAVPLIRILAVALVYKATAAIIQPVAEERISRCVDEMGNACILMASVVFLAGMMFLLFLAIVVGIGGGLLWRS